MSGWNENGENGDMAANGAISQNGRKAVVVVVLVVVVGILAVESVTSLGIGQLIIGTMIGILPAGTVIGGGALAGISHRRRSTHMSSKKILLCTRMTGEVSGRRGSSMMQCLDLNRFETQDEPGNSVSHRFVGTGRFRERKRTLSLA